jgi:CRP/FNR family transcriptional regulator, cyclic AMP receptor protein
VLEDRLAQIPLFSSLSKRERAQVARAADEVEVPEGKRLVEQGRFAYEFVAIEEGTAEVVQDGNTIRQLGPGDFFGEIGLLEAERRTASVIATSPMKLIVVFGPQLRSLERDMPELREQLQAAIRERLGR